MADPPLTDLAKQVTDLKAGTADLTTAANIVWTLVTGFLVLFMQAGFALVETGLCCRKNAARVMAMNFLVYTIGILGFWVMGSAFQIGGVGAMAALGNDATLANEFVINIGGKPFGLIGHGHVDFAASSVVHMTGGVAALVGAKILGPRIDKYDKTGKAQPMPGHNIPMALLGAFILAFGWFGFNPGSTLASGLDIPEMGVLAYPADALPHHLADVPEDSGRVPAGVGARVPG